MSSIIEFSFQGKHYVVPMEAKNLETLVLPDRRVLEVSLWMTFENEPPKPFGLREVTTTQPVGITIDQLVEMVHGILAEEVKT